MVEATNRRLSRMELLCTCISKMVCYLHKQNHDDLIKGMEHYYDPNDFNQVIYHNRNQEVAEKISVLLKDADTLLKNCGEAFDDVTEYQLLVRCLSEQTVVENAVRRLETKEDRQMNSQVMQNPSDPESTYRTKAGKEHIGYAANLEETVEKSGSVVTDYVYEPNIHSDSSFLKEHLNQMEKQGEEVILIADGGYSGKGNRDLAAVKMSVLSIRIFQGKMFLKSSPTLSFPTMEKDSFLPGRKRSCELLIHGFKRPVQSLI